MSDAQIKLNAMNAVNPIAHERVPKYPKTFHWPWSAQVHQDDRYHDAPEVFVGPEVVVTEKLDGGNTCLTRGLVYARSTEVPATAGWFAMVKKHHAFKTFGLNENIFVYGEDIFGVHSIKYDPVYEDETFYIFAVREGDYWYPWLSIVNFAATFDFITAPVVFRGVFKSIEEITKFFEAEIKRPSALGPTREGFVIRLADGFETDRFQRSVAKYVRKNHVQTDEHWRVNWKRCRLRRE